jgi:transcriptional regulator of acetoin/glycerol metabolism
VPVIRRERLVALVYLKAAEADMECLSEAQATIAEAVGTTARQGVPPSAVDAYLERAPAEEIERRKLLILLDRYEWNVARVARELRITRTTVYRRLVEFGIPRKRVKKNAGNPRCESRALATPQ